MAEREQDEQYGLDEQMLRQIGGNAPQDMAYLGGSPTFNERVPSPGIPLDGRDPNAFQESPLAAAPTGGSSRADRDQLRWGNAGQMSGFQVGSDYGGDQKARNSMKNTFGRLASNYAATPEGLRQLVASEEFRRYFPNARLLPGGAGDKIDFGGTLSDFDSGVPVGVVDVGQAFDPSNNSGAAWAWMDEANDGGGPMGGGGVGIPGGVDGLINADLSGVLAPAQQLTEGGDIDPALLQQMLGQELV